MRASLADHQYAADRARRQAVEDRLRQRLGGQADVEAAVALDDATAQRLAELVGGLRHLLEEVVRNAAPRDVTGRDLGPLQLGLDDRKVASVVRASEA